MTQDGGPSTGTAPQPVLTTDRLTLWQLSAGDAPFILRLLNEPSWLQYIGDRGVRTLADAQRYIETGPVQTYRRHGFGLYQVRLTGTGEPIGLCGLLRRDALQDVDLGFAFFPDFWSKGYAREASVAVMSHARHQLGLRRIVAITASDNAASRRLLERLGFRFERPVHLEPAGEALLLYGNTA